MSPNTVFPLDERPRNPITERVLVHPRVTFDVEKDAFVVAISDELLVRAAARTGALEKALGAVARLAGSLGGRRDGGLGEDIEIWRLNDPNGNSIDEARRLRVLARDEPVKTRRGPEVVVPAVSPNHVCCVANKYDLCPASPPHPSPPPHRGEGFIPPPGQGHRGKVVVIDTGYIVTDPPHAALDARVTSVLGEWFDTSTIPGTWRANPPDALDTTGDGRLDGVAGHGTFVAGLVAHGCPDARITVVGQRHDVMPASVEPGPSEQGMLFSTEFDVANAVLTNCDADVVSCGFAFPTLDAYASSPFTSVMQVLTGPDAPRPGVAVVSPAGNEGVARPYWPAAHPDVVGVAATNRPGNARAQFSNWGKWADCCARGEDVVSTFIYWLGPIEGEPLSDIEHFVGWARWDGTSFATPKVSAAIATLVAGSGGTLQPVDAAGRLLAGTGGVAVTPLTDMTLVPFPGVTLPHLHLG